VLAAAGGALAVGCATPQPERVLRLAPVVGTTQRIALSTDLQRGAEPSLRVQVVFSATADAVDAVRGTRLTIDHVELALGGGAQDLAPDIVQALAARMAWAEDVRGSALVTARGSVLQLDVPMPPGGDAETRALKQAVSASVEALARALAIVGIVLPEGAVTPGAMWRGAGGANGLSWRAVYELTTATAERARVKVDARLAGAIDGHFEGDVTYDFARALPTAAHFVVRGKDQTDELWLEAPP
jgi:hypothetical protein